MVYAIYGPALYEKKLSGISFMQEEPADTTIQSSHENHKDTRHLLFLALFLAFVIGWAFQGSRGLYESTEGRYAECARETLASGQFLEPILNGEPHWTKPPLTYWLIETGLVVFGNNPWGARAYLAITFILTVLAIYFAGRALWDKETGAIAALVYATCPYPIAAAFALSTDMPETMMQCACIACFWLAIRQNKRLFVFMMWAFFGLAVLTKGPVAIFWLFGAAPAYILLKRDKVSFPRMITFSGIVAFILIGSSWYFIEIARHPFLLNYWIMDETVGRFTANEFQRNPEIHKIVTLYLPIALFGALPWVFVVLFKRKHLTPFMQAAKQWRSLDDKSQWAFVVCGTIVPFVLLCALTSRMPLYLLPLFTPFVLGIARAITLLVRKKALRMRTVVIIACITAVLFTAGKGASVLGTSRANMARLASIVEPITEQNPENELIIACREDLNGLDFYLNRDLRRFWFPIRESDPPETSGTGVILPSGTLLVGRTKHLIHAEEYLTSSRTEIVYRDKNWMVLRITTSLDLTTLPKESTTASS